MSHLVLRKVDGKWKMFNKITKRTEGAGSEDKKELESKMEKRDEKEDKQIEKDTPKEHKEHPEFSKKVAKKIAADHASEGKGGGMEKTMKEFKEGKLHSGSKKGPEVTSRKQAIAIGMNSGKGGGKMKENKHEMKESKEQEKDEHKGKGEKKEKKEHKGFSGWAHHPWEKKHN